MLPSSLRRLLISRPLGPTFVDRTGGAFAYCTTISPARSGPERHRTSSFHTTTQLIDSRARPVRVEHRAAGSTQQLYRNKRHCSSEASSLLIKMASARDILPEEFVISICHSATMPDLFRSQCQADQLRHLPQGSQARRAMDLPRNGGNHH